MELKEDCKAETVTQYYLISSDAVVELETEASMHHTRYLLEAPLSVGLIKRTVHSHYAILLRTPLSGRLLAHAWIS